MLDFVLTFLIFVAGVVQIFFAKDYFRVYKKAAKKDESSLRVFGGVYGFFIGVVLILISLSAMISELSTMLFKN
jgi:uncharacterized protein YjeT (DUF2065 family)